MATTELMTAEDLWELDESHVDGRELIRGKLRGTVPNGEEHGDVSATITSLLWQHVRRNQLGTVYAAGSGFILSRNPDTVLAPDVAFIHAGQLPSDRDRSKFIELAPDLVVEVVSPSDLDSEFTERVLLFLNAGTRYVWTIFPSLNIVRVHHPDYTSKTLITNDELDGGDVLPGFKIAVAELFS